MKPADVAWPLRERNSLEISTRVEGTKHVQVGCNGREAWTSAEGETFGRWESRGVEDPIPV